MLILVIILSVFAVGNCYNAYVLNVTGSEFQKNKYMDSHVIVAFKNTGPKMCIKNCMLYTDCNAVNFDKNSFTCHLLTVSYPGDQITASEGYYFTDAGDWTKETDACWPNICPSGTKCLLLYGNERFCYKYDTPCDNHQCTTNGQCVNIVDGYNCRCSDGYYGTYCQFTPCTVGPCTNGGTCSVVGSTYRCSCPAGYYGQNCQKTPCTAKPCQNSGTCSISGSSFTCACPGGYSGTTCQITPCTSQPCLNSGTCSVAGSSYSCSCNSGYWGTRCENTPCTTQPCLNGGTCHISGSTYSCGCPLLWTGTRCELLVG